MVTESTVLHYTQFKGMKRNPTTQTMNRGSCLVHKKYKFTGPQIPTVWLKAQKINPNQEQRAELRGHRVQIVHFQQTPKIILFIFTKKESDREVMQISPGHRLDKWQS